jgi:hypothetical protein
MNVIHIFTNASTKLISVNKNDKREQKFLLSGNRDL